MHSMAARYDRWPANPAGSRPLPRADVEAPAATCNAPRSPMFRPTWSTSTSTRTPGFLRCWPRSSGSSAFRGENTPFLDNKAAFQLGINQVMRRTTTELVDTLGRVRGTSQIDQNLQDARTALAWDERAWYIGLRGPTRPTPSVYREAIGKLRAFNKALRSARRLSTPAPTICSSSSTVSPATSAPRPISCAPGSDASNAGWFDPRADDRFWFAYGQLYAYYGILNGDALRLCRHRFERNLTQIWPAWRSSCGRRSTCSR